MKIGPVVEENNVNITDGNIQPTIAYNNKYDNIKVIIKKNVNNNFNFRFV